MPLNFEKESAGVLDAILDADEELNRLAAIDQAVVVAERQVHHGANHDLAVPGDRALLNGVHSEDARLGRVQDGGRHQRAKDAAIRDGERAALELVERELVVSGLLTELGNLELKGRHAE